MKNKNLNKVIHALIYGKKLIMRKFKWITFNFREISKNWQFMRICVSDMYLIFWALKCLLECDSVRQT